MTKNVFVVDELGNKYASTYFKRAKGLVKNGRARWLDEDTICLACPPDTINSEDEMMDNMNNTGMNVEMPEVIENNTAEIAKDVKVEDILERIDAIIAQGDMINDAIDHIANLSDDAVTQAEAIERLISSREATNQAMIDLLKRVYIDRSRPDACSTADWAIEKLAGMNFYGLDADTAKVVADSILNIMNKA